MSRSEPVLQGVQRLLMAEIRTLTPEAATATLSDENIHDMRVNIKRARAHWRLLRGNVVGDAAFQRLDNQLRQLGRRLAPARDAAVKHATLDALATSARLAPELVARLKVNIPEADEVDVEAALREASEVQASFQEFERPLSKRPDTALTRLWEPVAVIEGRWVKPVESTSKKWQRERLRRALEKAYRSGRKRLGEVLAAPGAAPALHDLRKQVKYQANQLSLVGDSKKLQKRRKRLSRLGSLLGEHHDLFQLRLLLTQGPPHLLSPDEEFLVITALESQQAQLESKAVQLACRLFLRKPRRFSRWLREHASSLG